MNITALAYFTYFAIIGIQTSYLPNYYIKHHGFSGTDVSLLFMGNMLVGVCSHATWGQIADRTQKSAQILKFCALILMALYLALCFTVNLWAIAILFWSLGFFSAAMPALIDTIALTNYPTNYYGKIRLWGSIGYGFSVLIFPFIVIQYSPLYSIFFAAVVYNIVLIFAPSEKRSSCPKDTQQVFIAKILKIPGLLPLLCFSILHWSAHIAYNLCLDIHRDYLGLPKYITGIAICVGVISEIYCMANINKWRQKIYSYRFWFIAVASFSAIRWALLAYPLSSTFFVLLQLSQGITFGVFFTLSITYLREIIPQEILTSGQNVFYITTFSLGGAIGTNICGVLLDSPGKSFYVFLGASFISTLSLLQVKFITKE